MIVDVEITYLKRVIEVPKRKFSSTIDGTEHRRVYWRPVQRRICKME
jgi:hypothetical protein